MGPDFSKKYTVFILKGQWVKEKFVYEDINQVLVFIQRSH